MFPIPILVVDLIEQYLLCHTKIVIIYIIKSKSRTPLGTKQLTKQPPPDPTLPYPRGLGSGSGAPASEIRGTSKS